MAAVLAGGEVWAGGHPLPAVPVLGICGSSGWENLGGGAGVKKKWARRRKGRKKDGTEEENRKNWRREGKEKGRSGPGGIREEEGAGAEERARLPASRPICANLTRDNC